MNAFTSVSPCEVRPAMDGGRAARLENRTSDWLATPGSRLEPLDASPNRQNQMTGESRSDRVSRLRYEIAAGLYDVDGKIEAVLDDVYQDVMQ